MTVGSPAIAVVGAGGHAKVVVATLLAAGETNLEIYDDDPGRHGDTVLGFPVRGPASALSSGPACRAVLAVGDNRLRQRLAAELVLDWISVIHPLAHVAPSARIGPGSVVFAGAVVQPDCVAGRHVVVNTGATVDHDGRLGDFSHLAPGASLAGTVTVGEGALLGVGSSVLPGLEIGDWAVVGGGAAVIESVLPAATVAGVPARPVAPASGAS